jgi:hypothetical protein
VGSPVAGSTGNSILLPTGPLTSATTYNILANECNDLVYFTNDRNGNDQHHSCPTSTFIGNPLAITTGGTVNFTDQSTNSPTSWSWSFPGGTPSTSTLANPSVVYNTAGNLQCNTYRIERLYWYYFDQDQLYYGNCFRQPSNIQYQWHVYSATQCNLR